MRRWSTMSDVPTLPQRLATEASAAGIDRAVLPAQRPTTVTEAVRWAIAMLADGWYVAYQLETTAALAYLKSWEYGEEEPTWRDVLASSRPAAQYQFQATPAAFAYCNAILDSLERRGVSETEAVGLLNKHYAKLPWLTKEEIDPMREDVPEWWADRLLREPS